MISLLGAIFGFIRAIRCPDGLVHGRGLVLTAFSLGLFAWFLGSLVWTLSGAAIPYPSWADAGYLLQIPTWTVGIAVLFKHARKNILSEIRTPATLAVGIISFIVAAMLFVHQRTLTPSNEADLLKFAFDIAFPIGGILNLTLLVGLVFGRAMPVLIRNAPETEAAAYAWLVGTFLLAAADFIFNFTTSLPQTSAFRYYNGSWVDFVYWLAIYLLSIGVCLLPLPRQPREI